MTLDTMVGPVLSHSGHTQENALKFCRTARRSSNRQSIPIRLVTELDELEAIYRFRYKIYVEEQKRRQFHADHLARRIEDPLDHGGYNFAAFQGDEVVGVLRGNFPRTSNIEYYESFMDMCSAGPFHPSATSMCTRLMVAPRLRRTSLAMRLAQASYAFGLRNEIRYNFIDCDDHLVGFFTRLGYVFHRRAEHPEYGVGNVMRLDMLDRAHLVRQRSPFLAVLDPGGSSHRGGSWLH